MLTTSGSLAAKLWNRYGFLVRNRPQKILNMFKIFADMKTTTAVSKGLLAVSCGQSRTVADVSTVSSRSQDRKYNKRSCEALFYTVRSSMTALFHEMNVCIE